MSDADMEWRREAALRMTAAMLRAYRFKPEEGINNDFFVDVGLKMADRLVSELERAAPAATDGPCRVHPMPPDWEVVDYPTPWTDMVGRHIHPKPLAEVVKDQMSLTHQSVPYWTSWHRAMGGYPQVDDPSDDNVRGYEDGNKVRANFPEAEKGVPLAIDWSKKSPEWLYGRANALEGRPAGMNQTKDYLEGYQSAQSEAAAQIAPAIRWVREMGP